MSHDNLLLKFGVELLLWATVGALVFVGVLIVIKLRAIKQHMHREHIILELTPPPSPHNTLQATEEFFTVLHQVIGMRSWRELVNGQKATVALEVVSTRAQGVRYLVRMPRHDKPVFLHNLAAMAPTVTAEEVSEYLGQTSTEQTIQVLELKQTGRRDYALKHSYTEHINDPIAYLTNAINQLDDEELIAVQIVLSPAADWHLFPESDQRPSLDAVPVDIVAATTHKSRQPQFQSSLRILIQTIDSERQTQRVKGIRGALSAYGYEGYQSLEPRLDVPGWARRYRLYAFHNRLPALFGRHGCVLASSELAALYHFPYGTANQTEDIRVTRQVILPMPLAMKDRPNVDLILGENYYRGRVAPIGLTSIERERHMYVVGGTGTGKSTLLQYAIVQDMRAGKGVALIDPHGDLAETLLSYVPEDRIEDVIYFDPSDLRYPIGLNLLELPKGLDEDELLQEKDLVTESIVSMFRKIFSTNDTSGHRIEYVLRNAVQTALTLDKPTLFTVYDLLNDAAFRKRVVAGLDNADLKLFWREFTRGGSYQQVSMAAGITAKIGRFLFSASARRILEQPKSSINFDDLMQQRKILICNVSKGKLGEDTSELFGIMLLAKLQLATLRRASCPASERTPYHVYVDEFQNFATPSFVQLLSEARKYGLFLTMAEQSTSQQSDRRMIDIIFANVGTVISFRTSSPQDEQLLQPLLSPYVEPGTISRLPAHNFYVRIAVNESQPAFSGRTVLLDKAGDAMFAKVVIQASRVQYARKKPLTKSPKEGPKRREAVVEEPVYKFANAGTN